MNKFVLSIVLAFLTGNAFAADLPDPEKTPGVVEPKLTAERICAPGFSTKPWRHVSTGDKNYAYRAYEMKNHEGECSGSEGCEVDHLIPLELGGSNSRKNLWPQPFQGITWNAHRKDELENELHRMVCAKQLDLEEAQTMIRTDWIDAWKKVFGKDQP